jgi:hypothetical protein
MRTRPRKIRPLSAKQIEEAKRLISRMQPKDLVPLLSDALEKQVYGTVATMRSISYIVAISLLRGGQVAMTKYP